MILELVVMKSSMVVDYTPGTYTNISLTGGSGTGATATFTVSNAGLVSGIQIQDSGTGYERGDYLSVDDADLHDLEHLSLLLDLQSILVTLDLPQNLLLSQ